MHNLKVESFVLFGGLFEDFKPGRQDSKISLRDHSKEVWEKAGYIGVFAMKTR